MHLCFTATKPICASEEIDCSQFKKTSLNVIHVLKFKRNLCVKAEDPSDTELLLMHELKSHSVSPPRLAVGSSDDFGLCDGHFNL